MPSAVPACPKGTITKFTNCRLVKGSQLVDQDLWVSSATGSIISSQEAFYSGFMVPDEIIDLKGKILSPGLIDVQLNGAFGFDFSVVPEDVNSYGKKLRELNKKLVQTGVTSYLPTVTSQRKQVYHEALPFLGPSGTSRLASSGAESLGAHCEGPFISPTKNGIHKVSVLRSADHGISDLEDMYGSSNLSSSIDPQTKAFIPPNVKKITAAPEIGAMTDTIPKLTERGIIVSIGHTEATYEEASAALAVGATMVTHLFNAMRPLHHRNPGVFGVLGRPACTPTSGSMSPSSPASVGNIPHSNCPPRPFFGVIADGIHLHPSAINLAFNAHPSGFILVTDAMHLVGLPDGVYDWTNGERIVKRGPKLILEGSDDKIAGSSITLIECVSNFLDWCGASIPQALAAVTSTPARMLGLQGVKGCLDTGADADLVVLEEVWEEGVGVTGFGRKSLKVEQVWKFGERVW